MNKVNAFVFLSCQSAILIAIDAICSTLIFVLLVESLRSSTVHNFLHFFRFEWHSICLLKHLLRCVDLVASHHIHLGSRLLQFFLNCRLLLDDRQRRRLNIMRSVTTPAHVVAPAIFVLIEVSNFNRTIGHPVDALMIVRSHHSSICID